MNNDAMNTEVRISLQINVSNLGGRYSKEGLLCYTYTMKYYSTVRKDEILPFATTWMYLENIVVSKRSQMANNMISHRCGV